jgi:hypothetical protein
MKYLTAFVPVIFHVHDIAMAAQRSRIDAWTTTKQSPTVDWRPAEFHDASTNGQEVDFLRSRTADFYRALLHFGDVTRNDLWVPSELSCV